VWITTATTNGSDQPAGHSGSIVRAVDTDGRSLRAPVERLGALTADRLGGGKHLTELRGWRRRNANPTIAGFGRQYDGSGQPFAEVLPAVGTQLPIDGYPLDARLVAHELARRARLVLDFEDHLVAGTLLGDRLATEGTGVHLVDDGGNNT